MTLIAEKRSQMIPVSSGVRAYFAPLDPITGKPTMFDPAKMGGFDLGRVPAPWVDLGWIEKFKRSATTKWQTTQVGAKGATGETFRSQLGAKLEFEFCQWGKLQMALAAGSEQMNVLAADINAEAAPSGGGSVLPVAVLDGSTATELVLGIGAVDAFAVSDFVAVDSDYQQQVGYVGMGIAAAFVSDPVDVMRDRDYVRRVTFNVGGVAEKTTTSLILTQPLLGGVPEVDASVQKVVAFVDREGGKFLPQWSALFAFEEVSGGRVCLFYPRLQCCASAEESSLEVGDGFNGLSLKASFTALPFIDPTDNQQVVCYRSYFPAMNAPVY